MRTLLLAAVVLAALATPVRADESLLEKPRHRQGYFVGFGVHGALGYARESGDGVGPTIGTAYAVRAGQLLTPRLGLGLALDFGGGSGGGDSSSFGALSLIGQAILFDDVTLHAGVGLSITTLSSDTDDADAALRGVYGTAYTVGLTWDWFWTARKSGGWAITPGVQLRMVPGDTDAYGVMFGVELTRWSGLPRNQLELDVGDAYRK